MVAGNHDTPRTAETGWILRLFSTLGISVVEEKPERIRSADGRVSVLAIPTAGDRPQLAADSGARYNVLLTHYLLDDVAPRLGPHMRPSGIGLKDFPVRDYDYVGFGHYHVFEKLADNAFYSGSIEYTSSNIWREIDEERQKRIPGKGFIEFDLETGRHQFHAIPLARRVVDLPQIEAASMTAPELSDAISATVDECDGGIDDRIVRLIVRDVPRHILRDIDHRRIREFKRRALNFLLDARRPEPVRLLAASGAPGRRASLAETVKAMLESRDVTPGIDRKSLVDLGLFYLNEADRLAPAADGDGM
jgi:DNA repair exonuclease SbcCD nuclease subunit